ncbi:hypothetical protein BJV78DRAFT_1201814 [Lactifluus subvellereus]|nr:hypothetical protein BJV78DRAFT_1201814 [Lactifluus subvellereus]
MFRPIHSSPAHSLLRRHGVKHFSEKVSQKAGNVHREDVLPDPRPPWVYSASAGLRLVLIPSILFYAVFFADFGDRDHVFMPPRRWLQRQRDAFFTLTPEERKLVEESTTSRVRKESSMQSVAPSSER